MLSRVWWYVRAHVETFRQYPTAVVTAEALIWHHGTKGLDSALKAAEAPPTGDLREKVGVELVAKLAADRYLRFKHADLFERAAMLDRCARRRDQMIHPAEAPGPEVVTSTARSEARCDGAAGTVSSARTSGASWRCQRAARPGPQW